jgi:hypothetical protein
MTHNDFDFYSDLVKPILHFFRSIDLKTGVSTDVVAVRFPELAYIHPDNVNDLVT